jgi:hypothetical protein
MHRAAGECRRCGSRVVSSGLGEESGGRGQPRGVGKPAFFLEKEAASLLVGHRRTSGVHRGDDVAVLGVEAAQHVDHHAGVGDWFADVAQCVGETLELRAILRDGEISLSEAVELLLRLCCAMTHVAEELLLDGAPCSVRRVTRLDDDLKDIGGDRGVEPGDDGCVDLHPCDVILLEVDVEGAVDVVEEAELVVRDVEEGTSCGIVRGIEIKDHGNMVLDVDELRSGGGDRFRLRRTERIGEIGASGRRHEEGEEGQRKMEERLRTARSLIPCRERWR